jgi:TolB protein
MLCEKCGSKVEFDFDFPFCPHCGHRLDLEDALKRRGRLLGCAWAVAIALVACLILAGIGAIGIRDGLRERARLNQEAAFEHYSLGLTHLEKGELELAIGEFELALRLYPDYREAEEKLAEARDALKALATPAFDALEKAAAMLFEQALFLYEEGKWEEAAFKLEELRSFAPLYEKKRVEEMLFSALFKRGKELVEEERLEEALRFFDRALELRPEEKEASIQRKLAALYLTALSYWGADWEKTIVNFSALHNIDPSYKDVSRRLHDAYVNYGDLLAEKEEWCLAEEQYALALEVEFEREIEEKRVNANYLCLNPPPVITASIAITDEIVSLMEGKLALSVYNSKEEAYDVFVVWLDNLEWIRVAKRASQPSFSPDGERIAFRSQEEGSSGLHTINVEGEDEIEIVKLDGAIHPTWSPDGERIAYAFCKPGEEVWRIYVVSADGSGEAEEVAKGWSPSWGPEGRLAYTGCDEEGEKCGIYFTDENLANPVRITADPHDISISWSPDGTRLAYMSDHDGNWEVYVVALTGQVWRLTVNDANDGIPAWSPDGNYIAFLSDRDGSWGLYLMKPDGSEQRKVLDIGAEHPNWLEERISWVAKDGI